MGKSSNKKHENTFRFQTFSERITNINIRGDVILQIRHHDDTPEETSTYFGEALAKLSELNCTDHFTSFRSEISERVQTITQLVHHEEVIVSALKKHLMVPSSMALPQILDLVVQLARDLQKDFYRHFRDFFTLLVHLLSMYTQDPDILEKIFTCLSYIFKFLWRHLVKDIHVVYGYFSSLLGSPYKEYIRNFAAESFAFLMRKVKDQGSLFDFMFLSLKDNPDQCEGVGRLMFEMMRGVKDQFHSCTVKVLPLLLERLGPKEKQQAGKLPWQHVEESLTTTLLSMATHSNKQHFDPVWEMLLSAVSESYQTCKTSTTKKVKGQSAQTLERLLRLLQVLVDYKHGRILSKPDRVGKVLTDMLGCSSLPSSCGEEVMSVTSALLAACHTQMEVETTSRMIAMVYKTSFPPETVFNFTRSTFDLPLFEKDVLPSLLPYCQSRITMDTGSCGQMLGLLTDLLINKSPLIMDGSELDNADTYMLDFGAQKGKLTVPSHIVSLLDGADLDTREGRAKVWAACVCLPHIRPLPNTKSVISKLSALVSSLADRPTLDEGVSMVLYQSLASLVVMKSSDEVFQLVPKETIFDCLMKNSGNIHILLLTDVYLSLATRENVPDIFTADLFNKIFPLLQENLSSHHSRVRLPSLRILAGFQLPLLTTDQDVDVPDVFQLCLNAESTPATFHCYRDKLRHLQKLEYSAVQSNLPAGPVHQVPVRYLIGCLFVNFKLLWEPITTLIASHAYGMDKVAFWEVYGKHLLLAAEKAEEELFRDVGAPASESDPNSTDQPVVEMFTDSLSHLTTDPSNPDYTNFRLLLWKTMHEFTDKCEPRSREFVPLFFRFLENEYYQADSSVAPTQNLLRETLDTADALDETAGDLEDNKSDSSPAKTKTLVSKKDMQGRKRKLSSKEDDEPVKQVTDMLGKRPRTRSRCESVDDDMDVGMGMGNTHSRVRTRSQCSSGIESDSEMEVTSKTSRTSTNKKRVRTRSQCDSESEKLDSDRISVSEVTNKTAHTKLDGTRDSSDELTAVNEKNVTGDKKVEKTKKGKLKGKRLSAINEEENGEVSELIKEGKALVKGTVMKRGIITRKKAATSSFLVQLQLFAKFKDPRSICMEPKLRELYFNLLTHKNAEVQRTAFDCILTYKYQYLTPYKENFLRLLDDKTFKNEIVLFSIDHENTTINDVHRPELLQVLMRILYGKMFIKTGKGTSGKRHAGIRQSIVFRFLNGCRHEELSTFIDLVFAPFQQFVTDNALTMVNTVLKTTDLTKVMPIKQLQGVLNSMDMIFKKLGHLLDPFLPQLIQIVTGIGAVCCVCLQHREKIVPSVLAPLKSIRQLTMHRIIQVLEGYGEYAWSPVELDAVFEALVWPQLDKLSYEGLYHPTPILKFLHSCTKNPRYFPLLGMHRENDPTLTPLTHVMRLLLHSEVSAGVTCCIMEMVDNLLTPPETDEDQQYDAVQVNNMVKLSSVDNVQDSDLGVRLLLSHLGDILLHIEKTVGTINSHLARREDSFKELNILSRISSFVQDAGMCAKLVHLLLPYLGKVSRSQKTEEEILTSVDNLLKLVPQTDEFYLPIGSLFSSLTNRNSRSLLCHVFEVVCGQAEERQKLAKIIHQLNSWDRKRVEEPDYMQRLEGFKTANHIIKEMVTIDTNICLPLIHNCCYFIGRVEDMSIRDSSTHCLVTIVTHSGHVNVDGDTYNKLISGGILQETKHGLRNKSETVRHEFVTVLTALVDTFGDRPSFVELKALRDSDLEADFYENIKHIQLHKRSRGLRRLIKYLRSTKLRNEVLLSYFLPLASAFLIDETYKKHPALQDAAVDALGAVCQQLPWRQYLQQLKYFLQLLPKKLENQKLLVRVIVSILDAFHFDLSSSTLNLKLTPEVKTESTEDAKIEGSPGDTEADGEEMEIPEINEAVEDSETNEELSTANIVCPPELATRIHTVIMKSVIPQLHKVLVKKIRSEEEHKLARSNYAEDDEILRVPIALAMVKLLHNLPKQALERQLPGILLKVCNFLKSRSTDIRNTSRDTLVNIQASLGPRFFPFILNELRGTLRRGYQRHVLCYTVHLLLKKMEPAVRPGDIDVCLKNLQAVFNEEIFGEVSEEKEVDGIVAKVFEARSSKSYESYELIARYIGRGSLSAFIQPLKQILDTTSSHKSARKVQEVLLKVVHGLMENKDIPAESLLAFIHGLTTQTLPVLVDRSNEKSVKKSEQQPGQRPQSCLLLPQAAPRGGNKPKTSKKTNIHVLVEFGLQLLNMCLKRQRVSSTNTTHLEMLDPLVSTLIDCLYSKYIMVNACSLRTLCWLLRFPLPAIETNIVKIANAMFILLRSYASAGTARGDNKELVAMLFKAVTVLVRHVKFYNLEVSQLQVLLTFCEEDLHDYNRQSTAFTLLKAILSRKLDIPEIHELMRKVEEMSITSESAFVRRECRQVTLQYLLDYPLGKKLHTHLKYFVSQLAYEVELGRESALEMMASFFSTFPLTLLSEYSGMFFVPMSASLVNDDSPKCRKLTALALKSLLGKLDFDLRTKLFAIAIKWFMDDKIQHRTLAAQVCGLFVEVEGHMFDQRLSDVLPVIEQQLEPGRYEQMEQQSVEHDQDHLIYNILNTLIKLLRECDNIVSDSQYRENMNVIWERVQYFLTYPHNWVQLAASQLFGLLFAATQPGELVSVETDNSGHYLGTDTVNKLQQLSSEFVTQLQSELLNEDLANQVVKNMIFLTKCARHMDEKVSESESSSASLKDDKTKKFSVKLMVVKMTREAHHEAIHKTNVSLKRLSVFKWMAAVGLDLGETMLPSVLGIMITPLQREVNDQTATQDPALKSLAQEVLDMLKKVAGMEKFTAVYASTQRVRTERRDERKANRAYQAVANPEVAAKRKIKKHLQKKESRKRKMEEKKKPSKKAKKKKFQDFVLADN